jgi:hypothetical protein
MVEVQDGSVERGWRLVDKAYLISLQTMCAASVALTVFYWALIYQKGSFLRVGELAAARVAFAP